MSATLEQFEPSANGAGKIGLSSRRWGEGHFAALYVGGVAVAPVASPSFSGVPTAPTASGATNTTQIATTAFVQTAATSAKNRSNHTGTQTASTISDFDTAVSASTAGAKAHDANSDTKLASGTGNEVTAAALRTHLDDATKHRQINDAATSSTSLWSSEKTAAAIAAGAAAGALADLDTVGTDQIDDDSVTSAKIAAGAVTTALLADTVVTGAKVAGGSATPGNSKYWGTDSLGNWGFHDVGLSVKTVLGTNEGLLATTGGLHVVLGTAANRAAAGDDARFPTSDEKAALAGQTGTPSSSNKFLTLDWANADILDNATWTTGTSTTKARVSPAQVVLAAGPGFNTAIGSIASAASIDIGATTAQWITISGTASISALGTAAAGVTRWLTFAGNCTLVHNATSLRLPGACNIGVATTAVAQFRSLGSGNWQCVQYVDFGAGFLPQAPRYHYAITSSMNLQTYHVGNLLTIDSTSGAVDITIQPNATVATPEQSMFSVRYTGANTVRIVKGSGVTLYNATTDANITLTAGVVYTFYRLSTNVWVLWSTSN